MGWGRVGVKEKNFKSFFSSQARNLKLIIMLSKGNKWKVNAVDWLIGL